MTACTVYYHPECSKSRALLALLAEHAVSANLVDYRLNPLPKEELVQLVELLGEQARDLLRRDDPAYASLGLSGREPDAADIVNALQQYPQLMQRPILVCGAHAVIARPVERALALL
ncbi:MAG: arsenate reductase (glutaredoxin) [Rhodanobacteraceae bacterium]|nr:arsenate reductase (glutaredoxin) [Rhodanobacteraceae bacterium]